ncbi:DUF808 domain-containing protein [Rhabdaerophilum sp. SD176]|uniref:DUF808 domain-containing protein n=1 Tax=Rhabdaerophilum sp. SD176 TaxID=2983548 RepID=UPI0024E02797|nr:DUF808 domain-containing protein [Rhabdaerophilum sp. SD176]
MSIGLIALLDDIAAIAKVAAASLDDVATQAAQAGGKAAGVVIDDAAVTPGYVTGFSPARELPIIRQIAVGSLKNKLIILLPAALLLSSLAPWAITPLLMIGGAYLCYEGAEKVFGLAFPHAAHHHESELAPVDVDPGTLEQQKIAGAIKTDFILSAEIMVITLGSIPAKDIQTQAAVLAIVGIGITVAVYGVVALIVKLDDIGLLLARSPASGTRGAVMRGVGRLLVRGTPKFLVGLGLAGTLAMLWVGGGIFIHGLEQFGLGRLAHWLHDAGAIAAGWIPALPGFMAWLGEAVSAGVFGLALGLALMPVAARIVSPLWSLLSRALAALRSRAGAARTNGGS